MRTHLLAAPRAVGTCGYSASCTRVTPRSASGGWETYILTHVRCDVSKLRPWWRLPISSISVRGDPRESFFGLKPALRGIIHQLSLHRDASGYSVVSLEELSPDDWKRFYERQLVADDVTIALGVVIRIWSSITMSILLNV